MRLHREIRRAAVVAAAAALLLCAPPAWAETVEVVCTVHEWCSVVQRAFAKATGIQVNIVELSSSKALDLIVSERDRPKHDLWFGGTGEFHLQAANMRLTLAYRSPNTSLLHDWGVKLAQQSGYRTNGIYSGPLGFVYNPAVLAAAKVAPPRCWADLVKPEYRNLVQVSNPSGVYSVIATLVQLMGEDDAFDYLRKLHRNIRSYTGSGTESLANVARGDTGVVIAFVYGINAEITAGNVVKMATPCEGTGYEIGSMSIIKGGPNPNGAKRFFDWALTAAAQDLMAQTQQFKVASNRSGRVDGRIVDPSVTRLIDYDFIKYGSLDERVRLLDKWHRTVENGATR